MPAPRKYPNELRERAQRLVAEAREQDQALSLNAAVLRIGPRVGVNPDTLRGWCKQGDIDAGRRPGTTTSDGQAIKQLQAEVMILLKAYDDTFSQTVLARYSYRFDEIGWNQQFAPAFSVDSDGDLVLELQKVGQMGAPRA